MEAARHDDALLIDGALTAASANTDTVAAIARAGPFGAGNPEPVIALPGHTLIYAEEVGHGHLRARLRAGDGATINAVAFRAVGQGLGSALAQSRGRAIHAAGTLCLDRWNGSERVQLRLIDIASARLVSALRNLIHAYRMWAGMPCITISSADALPILCVASHR